MKFKVSIKVSMAGDDLAMNFDITTEAKDVDEAKGNIDMLLSTMIFKGYDVLGIKQMKKYTYKQVNK